MNQRFVCPFLFFCLNVCLIYSLVWDNHGFPVDHLGILLQSFLIVSDPSIAKHILRDNSKSYSKVNHICLFFIFLCIGWANIALSFVSSFVLFNLKGILAEILEFVMGKGLIPADGEIWRIRRRAIVPALHQKVF